MVTVQTELSDRVESEITRLVERGEFLNREQAVEELLTMGISAYNVEPESDELESELFSQAAADQQDPAMEDDFGF